MLKPIAGVVLVVNVVAMAVVIVIAIDMSKLFLLAVMHACIHAKYCIASIVLMLNAAVMLTCAIMDCIATLVLMLNTVSIDVSKLFASSDACLLNKLLYRWC